MGKCSSLSRQRGQGRRKLSGQQGPGRDENASGSSNFTILVSRMSRT